MKFNRKLLEEETLQKIKEVNDEAGYRSYLEVPEMVNIIASIIEEKYMQIIHDTLRELPVGNVSTHTPESIPERVGHWVRESAEECRLREQWEACADNLIDYAHEFVAHLSLWGKGYGRYDKDIKLAEDAIEVSTEQVNGLIFAYNKTSGEFLAQAQNLHQVMVEAAKRYPGKKFWHPELKKDHQTA